MLWWEILGNNVTAADVYRLAREAGLSLEEFVREVLATLAVENPAGGWEPSSDLAREIAREIEDAAEQR